MFISDAQYQSLQNLVTKLGTDQAADDAATAAATSADAAVATALQNQTQAHTAAAAADAQVTQDFADIQALLATFGPQPAPATATPPAAS